MIHEITSNDEGEKTESIARAQRDTLVMEFAIPEADLCDRLRRAVEDAADRDAESMKRLRLAVGSFTVALRDIGTTPERVLIALKTVINNRSFVSIPPHVSDWSGDELRQQASTWCIEAFFRKDPPERARAISSLVPTPSIHPHR